MDTPWRVQVEDLQLGSMQVNLPVSWMFRSDADPQVVDLIQQVVPLKAWRKEHGEKCKQILASDSSVYILYTLED